MSQHEYMKQFQQKNSGWCITSRPWLYNTLLVRLCCLLAI